MIEKRETLTSGLGFLLVSAGCAVGLGNVWRFPYIVGENGGALFVLLYIVFLIIFGLPMLGCGICGGKGIAEFPCFCLLKAFAQSWRF